MQQNFYNAPLNQGLGEPTNPSARPQKLTPEEGELYEELQTLHSIMVGGHVSKGRVETFFKTRGADIGKYAYCPLDHRDEENSSNTYMGEDSASINPRIVPRKLLMAMEVSPYLCENHLAEIGLRNAGYDLAKIDYLVVPREEEFSDVKPLSQRLEDAKADFNVVIYTHPSMTGKAEQRQIILFYDQNKYRTPDSKQATLEAIKKIDFSVEVQQPTYIDDKVSVGLYETLPFIPLHGLQQIVEGMTQAYRIITPEDPAQSTVVIFEDKEFYADPATRQRVVTNLEIANRAVQLHEEGKINDEDLVGIVNKLAENTVPQVTQAVVEETATLLATPIQGDIYESFHVLERAGDWEYINIVIMAFNPGYVLEPCEQDETVKLRFTNTRVTQQELQDAVDKLKLMEWYNARIRNDPAKMKEVLDEIQEIMGPRQQ